MEPEGSKLFGGSDIRPAIVKLAMKLLEKYQSSRDCPPSQFLEELEMKECDECNDPIFAGHKKEVAELFLHIVKMEKFLRVIAEEYCDGKSRPRTDDVLLIIVMLYIIIFKLTRTSRSKVKILLTTLHQAKAFNLLGYLNKVDFPKILKEAAVEMFTYDYVKDNILQPFIKENMLKVLHNDIKCDLLAEKQSRKIPLTVAETPKVLQHHQPSPPAPCPTPINFPLIKYARDIPNTTYEKPLDAEILKKKALERKEKSATKLKTAETARFRCATAEKSQHYHRTIEEIANERAARSAPLIKQNKTNIHKKAASLAVKVNAATVLREGARLMKDEEKIVKKLEAMATGSSNFMYYDNLEAEWRKKKEEEFLEEIARKHLKGQLTYEEAVLARRRVLESNKEKRVQFEIEKEELNHKLEQWRTEEQLKVKRLMEKCQNSFKGAKLAQTSLHERKVKEVQELNEESKELMQKALIQKEEELSRKISLIKEIRALQSLSLLRVKEIDLTETPGIGLMCEMSIAELRERLCILKIDMQEELEERQTIIKQQRERQQRLVKDTQLFIQQHRDLARRNTRQEKKPAIVPKTQELEKLRQELEEKREQRKKLQLSKNI